MEIGRRKNMGIWWCNLDNENARGGEKVSIR